MRQSNKHEIKGESIIKIATEAEKANIIRGRTVIRSRGSRRIEAEATKELETEH